MADEPTTNAAVLDAPPPPVAPEPEPELSVDDYLRLQAQGQILEDDTPDEEEADEPPASPITPAERKRLADLVQNDPAYRQEFEQLAAQESTRKAQEAAAAERQKVLAEQRQDYINGIERDRAAQLAYRPGEDNYLYQMGVANPIRAQEERDLSVNRRSEEDQAYKAWKAQMDGQDAQQGQITQTQRAEQAQFYAALTHGYRTTAPLEVQDVFKGKGVYPGSFHDGVSAWIGDLITTALDHGKTLGRAEAAAVTEKERTQSRSQRGLSEASPDMGGATGSAVGARTLEEIDALPLAERLALQKADPFIYDKAAKASARRRR